MFCPLGVKIVAETTYGEAVSKFLEWLQHSKGRSARTIDAYRLAFDRLAEYLVGQDPLAVTHEQLVMFSGRWLFERGVSASARRPYVAAVRMFFKWAAGPAGIVRKNPATHIEYAKGGSKIPIKMGLANAEKLLHQPDLSTFKGLRDAAMLHILVGCGVRVTGLVNINEGDFVPDVINGEPRLFLKVREKGDQEQIKLLPQQADLVVRMYLEHPDLQLIDRTIAEGKRKGDKIVFVSMKNNLITPDENIGERRRITRDGVQVMVRHYGKKAGLPMDQMHPHAMRHLFGTELVEGDVDLSRVQKMMGHKDPKSTLIYLHLASAKLAKELDRANPLAKIDTPISRFLTQLKKPK